MMLGHPEGSARRSALAKGAAAVDDDSELREELGNQLFRAQRAGLDSLQSEALIWLGRYRVLTREQTDAMGIDLSMAKVLEIRGLARIDNDPERGWSIAITDDGDRVLREDPSGGG
jgi:hypothetical protein